MQAKELKEQTYAKRYFEGILENLQRIYDSYEKQEVDPFYDRNFNYFKDGNRKIDIVMVYNKANTLEAKGKVNKLLLLLAEKGFQFEGEDSTVYPDLIFIKTFCPRNILLNAAAILNIHLGFLSTVDWYSDYSTFFNFEFLFNDLTKPNKKSDVAQRAYESTFNLKPVLMTSAERSMVIFEMMKHVQFSYGFKDHGIFSLLKDRSLVAIYPLHDGDFKWKKEGPLNDRQLLYRYWAQISNYFKLQPIDLIHKYYGPEIAFYFAYLGFYNSMLLPMVISGLIAFIYGLLTMDDLRNHVSTSICSSKVTLCPECPNVEACPYQLLAASCSGSKMNYLVDNPVVYIHVIIMCLWTTIIQVGWKRRQIVLMHKWDLMSTESGTVRPEYTNRKKKTKLRGSGDGNVVDGQNEEESAWLHLARCTASAILVCFVCILMTGLPIILIGLQYVLREYYHEQGKYSHLKHFAVAALANVTFVIVIILAETSYFWLSQAVTNFENPRTQEEYDHSVIYKLFVLSFLTTYSYLFYHGLFKGRFTTYPGDISQFNNYFAYDTILAYNNCAVFGQLWTIIVFGKGIIKRILLGICKWIINKYRKRHLSRNYGKSKEKKGWEWAYSSAQGRGSYLLAENMRLATQFGFLFIFPGAMPLGPTVGFFYNCLLIRSNAYSLTVQGRRPVSKRQAGIGAWSQILKFNSYASLISFYLAFSTEMVPYLGKSLNRYRSRMDHFNYTFSEFAVNDFGPEFDPKIRQGYEGTSCYYRGHRFPPSSPRKYQNTVVYWNEYAYQFVAVICLQVIFVVFHISITWLAGDIPFSIRESLNFAKRKQDIKRERDAQRLSDAKNRSAAEEEKHNLREHFKIHLKKT